MLTQKVENGIISTEVTLRPVYSILKSGYWRNEIFLCSKTVMFSKR